jgi:hypothetical protein
MRHIKSELHTKAAKELDAQAKREAEESPDKSLAKLLENQNEQPEGSGNDSTANKKTS